MIDSFVLYGSFSIDALSFIKEKYWIGWTLLSSMVFWVSLLFASIFDTLKKKVLHKFGKCSLFFMTLAKYTVPYVPFPSYFMISYFAKKLPLLSYPMFATFLMRVTGR